MKDNGDVFPQPTLPLNSECAGSKSFFHLSTASTASPRLITLRKMSLLGTDRFHRMTGWSSGSGRRIANNASMPRRKAISLPGLSLRNLEAEVGARLVQFGTLQRRPVDLGRAEHVDHVGFFCDRSPRSTPTTESNPLRALPHRALPHRRCARPRGGSLLCDGWALADNRRSRWGPSPATAPDARANASRAAALSSSAFSRAASATPVARSAPDHVPCSS